MDNQYYVYIMTNKNNTVLYTGITNDIQHRLTSHNNGKASKYTRARLPVKLCYQEPHKTKSLALKRELEIKGWPRNKKKTLFT